MSKGAAGAYLQFGKQVLLLKRSGYVTDDPNVWSIPFGSMDEGEKPEDTARREIFEETKIKIPDDVKATLLDVTDQNGTKLHTFLFDLTQPGEEPPVPQLNEENSEGKWTLLSEFPTEDVHPGLNNTREFIAPRLGAGFTTDEQRNIIGYHATNFPFAGGMPEVQPKFTENGKTYGAGHYIAADVSTALGSVPNDALYGRYFYEERLKPARPDQILTRGEPIHPKAKERLQPILESRGIRIPEESWARVWDSQQHPIANALPQTQFLEVMREADIKYQVQPYHSILIFSKDDIISAKQTELKSVPELDDCLKSIEEERNLQFHRNSYAAEKSQKEIEQLEAQIEQLRNHPDYSPELTAKINELNAGSQPANYIQSWQLQRKIKDELELVNYFPLLANDPSYLKSANDLKKIEAIMDVMDPKLRGDHFELPIKISEIGWKRKEIEKFNALAEEAANPYRVLETRLMKNPYDDRPQKWRLAEKAHQYDLDVKTGNVSSFTSLPSPSAPSLKPEDPAAPIDDISHSISSTPLQETALKDIPTPFPESVSTSLPMIPGDESVSSNLSGKVGAGTGIAMGSWGAVSSFKSAFVNMKAGDYQKAATEGAQGAFNTAGIVASAMEMSGSLKKAVVSGATKTLGVEAGEFAVKRGLAAVPIVGGIVAYGESVWDLIKATKDRIKGDQRSAENELAQAGIRASGATVNILASASVVGIGGAVAAGAATDMVANKMEELRMRGDDHSVTEQMAEATREAGSNAKETAIQLFGKVAAWFPSSNRSGQRETANLNIQTVPIRPQAAKREREFVQSS